MLVSGSERFTAADLAHLADLVAAAWAAGIDHDWSARAGTLEWSCLKTADHAVDCVYAPAFFLASRRVDRYPDTPDLSFGESATPPQILESLAIASRMLVAVVRDADPQGRTIIFRWPSSMLGLPADFLARGAVELMLHAHDVCFGLEVPFEPPPPLAYRLREHTRPWPMWAINWNGIGSTDDPWGDLLLATGRHRPTCAYDAPS
jgi:hypothetical protein